MLGCLLLSFIFLPATGMADHGSYTIQLKAFNVPVQIEGKQLTRKKVTIYFQVNEKWMVKDICQVEPRLKQAIYLELDRKPITGKFRRMEMEGVALRLLPALNEDLGANLISHMYVVPSLIRIAKGTRVARVEGSTATCVTLLKLPMFVEDYPSATPEMVEVARPGVDNQQAEKGEIRKSPIKISADGKIIGDDENDDATEAAPSGQRCIRGIQKLWPAGLHFVDSRWYWLKEVKTIDEDGDGEIENVSFHLKSEGLEDVRLSYFSTNTGLTVASVKTLMLEDQRLIGRLCPNSRTYLKPPPGKGYPAGYVQPVAPELTFDEKLGLKYNRFKESDMFLMIIISGMFFLLMAFLVLGYLSYNRQKMELREFEEEFGEDEVQPRRRRRRRNRNRDEDS